MVAAFYNHLFLGALTGSKDPLQKIDQDQLDAYKRAFDEFDLDGDGKISTQVIIHPFCTKSFTCVKGWLSKCNRYMYGETKFLCLFSC